MYSFYKCITDGKQIKKALEFLIERKLGIVIFIFIKQMVRSAFFVKNRFQISLLQQRQDRRVIFYRKRKINFSCRILRKQKFRGYGKNKQIHLRNVVEIIFICRDFARIFLKID